MKRRRDPHTSDLFATDWEPPQVAVGYAPDVAGRGRLDSRIARLVSRALRDARDEDGKARADIARCMSAYLDRPVSEAMLNKWAAEASEEHRIPLDAFVALIEATEAKDLLGFVPELFGFAVVPERYASLIEAHLWEEREQEAVRRRQAAEMRWRASR
ncbi:hypothetical protein FQ775_01170 [Nitratireductor mangrovi]|uniref:Uncharacterized protein n=1 Tax=Nitratireductor mangrovi TaxID=2599600 RepID=A0A5B8KU42_9HYPH|nr:hypothetical protein [Nitratireductor mangrovi]QDY99092.1 hypothetical protein FQ775_01170 [Nitratireductor mangrovi]